MEGNQATDTEEIVGLEYTPPVNPVTPPKEGEKNPPNDPLTEDPEGNNDPENNEDDKNLDVKDFINSLQGKELSEEDQALKADLLTYFKGTQFDAQGNIVTDDGEIVAKFEDIEQYVNGEEEEESEPSFIQSYITNNKLEILDADGKPKEYPDTEEGLSQLIADTSELQGRRYFQNMLSQSPELEAVAKHLLSGKDISTYNSNVDYDSLDVKKMSKEDKLQVIREDLKASNFSEERISSMITMIIDSNTIDVQTKTAIESSKNRQALNEQQREADFQAAEARKQQDIVDYWNNVQATVTKGDLGYLSIPDKEKAGFFEYMSKPVNNNGESQEVLDLQKETIETQLAISYLRYKGYDLNSLVKAKAGEEKVKSLRERMRKSSKAKFTGSSVTNTNPNNNDDEIVGL